MMPRVTVVCVCFQHSRFIREALQSVADQTYPEVELIVVDDGSTDGSAAIIRAWAANHPGVKLVLKPENRGYCAAFNSGWRLGTGDFFIDLAGDDILLPNRIAKGIAAFTETSKPGIQFTDACYISASGTILSTHSDRFPSGQVPQGNVFTEVVRRYFICSPTMMMSRAVLEHLQGYDETLQYEDFDLWVRGARVFPFYYLPDVLVKKRVLAGSLSAQQFRGEAEHNRTTYRVCEKALALAETLTEKNAVRYRVLYEARQRARSFQWAWVARYALLWLRTWT